MNSKPHRTNSDFQLRHFLAGSCSTPDGAWVLLYGQRADIRSKLTYAKSSAIKVKATRIRISDILADPKSSIFDRLMAEVDQIELDGNEETNALNVQAAQDELATIEKLMDELEPLRKYAHLPLLEASEASQRDEWLGELKRRAENFLVTCGTIPHDHFDTMRLHPDFDKEIAPFIRGCAERINAAGAAMPQLKAPTLLIGGGDVREEA